MDKTIAVCAKWGHTIFLPCNWNVDGWCGADTKKCVVRNIKVGGVNW